MSSIPQSEMVVLAGDMNGHVGSNNVGCDGTHCSYRYGVRTADGSMILEFADRLPGKPSHLQYIVHEAGI